ncbi:MAG: c-type cytochrome [Proteobacteria bacterium]|nr:c-type cytochrome [Pseudomonadota bacterium]
MADEHVPDQLLGHSQDNDGIQEYDNDLPDWWLGLFFICIIWAGFYVAYYHGYMQTSQAQLYDEEVAAAIVAYGTPEEVDLASVEITPEMVAAGEPVYVKNCVICHGETLEGGPGGGPSLVDAEWIHGGSYPEIVHTVSEGVPAKGMLTWGPILGEEKVQQVSAYVLSKAQAAGN